MNEEYILKSAMQIQQVSEKTANEYIEKSDLLVSVMNKTMLERADINDLVSEKNMGMMKDNHANHVRFISSMLKEYNPEVLVDTVLWVFRAYRSHGFTTNYWAAQLNTWLTIFKGNLSNATYNELLPLYNWMQVNIPQFVKLSDKELKDSQSLH